MGKEHKHIDGSWYRYIIKYVVKATYKVYYVEEASSGSRSSQWMIDFRFLYLFDSINNLYKEKCLKLVSQT